MTISSFDVQEIHFADEIAFGELLQTTTIRCPATQVRVQDWTSGRATDRSRQNRLATTRPGFLMPRGPCTLEIDFLLCGANVDTATGALAGQHLQKLLADGLGGGDLTEVGGLAGATATATAMASATGTRVRGGVVRVGQKKDGRADGQAAVTGNPTTALLTALPAAPGATDVVRAAQLAYFTETAGATKRFVFAWNSTQNPGAQYGFHGCQLMNAVTKVTHGDLTTMTLSYSCANWRELSGFTMPSALTLADCKSAVAAGGSYFLQTVGTATRPSPQEQISELVLTLNIGLTAQIGQGGATELQHIVGWVRTKTADQFGTMSLTLPHNPTKQTEYDADGSDTVHKHFLACLSVGEGAAANEGRHAGFYLPDIYPVGNRPTPMSWNGLLYMTTMYALTEGPDTTNDLTRSAIRFYFS